jgi:radical SAM-linked protein
MSSSSESSSRADAPPGETAASSPRDEPLRIRYRIRFAKTELLRWISHRDLARLWERLVRRAQLQLSMTEGFHPKPRIGFPSALALGIHGIDEVVELDLAEEIHPRELLGRLASDPQPGLRIKSVQRMPPEAGKAKLERSDYEISRPDPQLGAPAIDEQALRTRIADLLRQETVTVTRKNKPLTVRVADQILALRLDQTLQLSLAASDAATLKPTDVLDLLGCQDWTATGAQITRTDVVLKREFKTADPEFFATANQTPDKPPAHP